jgi:hypothetical protein
MIVLVSAILLASQPVNVSAHNPSLVALDYDLGTETLTVTVSHAVPVSDLSFHYIFRIVVEKNSVQFISRNYTSGDNTISGTADTFSVPAVDGDVLVATAYCTLAGVKSGQMTVSTSTDTTTTGTNTDTWLPVTAMILGVLIVLGVVVAIVLIARRR